MFKVISSGLIQSSLPEKNMVQILVLDSLNSDEILLVEGVQSLCVPKGKLLQAGELEHLFSILLVQNGMHHMACPCGSLAYCLHFACDEVCPWYKISGLMHNRRAVASIQAVQIFLSSMRHAWLSVPSTEGISKLKTSIVGCLCRRQTPSALTSF